MGDVGRPGEAPRFWPRTAPARPTVHQVTSPAEPAGRRGCLTSSSRVSPWARWRLGGSRPPPAGGRWSSSGRGGAGQGGAGGWDCDRAPQQSGHPHGGLPVSLGTPSSWPNPSAPPVYSLVLSARGLFIFHVTTHVSLREAIERITKERVLAQIRLAHLLAKALGPGGSDHRRCRLEPRTRARGPLRQRGGGGHRARGGGGPGERGSPLTGRSRPTSPSRGRPGTLPLRHRHVPRPGPCGLQEPLLR